jgi:TolB-like protein/Tfp pilus assembly protein PilF
VNPLEKAVTNTASTTTWLAFGPFSLDLRNKILTSGGDFVPMPPKELNLLVFLVAKGGELATREEILQHLWPNVFVEEANISRMVSFLRQRLARYADREVFIETVPKRGYRFVADLRPTVTTSPQSGKATLVVLPFLNLDSSADQDYFTDGFTEELITHLSRLDPARLGVIARTSSMIYKNAGKSIEQIGRELHATHVLEGSIRRYGDRVRISAQLVHVTDQLHLWADNYERHLDDVLRVHEDVAIAIASRIKERLDPAKTVRTAEPPTFSIAYDLYLRGRQAFHLRTEEDLRRSISLFERAIQIDDSFPLAYCGIADARSTMALRGMVEPQPALASARTAALKAIEIRSDLGEAYCSLAFVKLNQCDWPQLENDFVRAIDLTPSQAIVYCWYGKFLTAMGRFKEALMVSEKARLLDPFAPQISAAVGWYHYLARDPERAVNTLTEIIRNQAPHFLPKYRLGLTLAQTGQYQHALDHLEKASQLANGSTETRAAIAMVHAAQGNRRMAESIVSELIEQRSSRWTLAYNIARVYAAFRDHDRTLKWLWGAYHEGDPDVSELGIDPLFDFLRSDNAFRSLLADIGVDQPAPSSAAMTQPNLQP